MSYMRWYLLIMRDVTGVFGEVRSRSSLAYIQACEFNYNRDHSCATQPKLIAPNQ